MLGLLGGLLAVGVGAAAAGGGGGGKSEAPTPTPPAPDTTPPAAPTGLALAAADDSGSSSTDRITNITQGLTITGTAEANSSVELFNGATSLGKVTANASGAFTIDVTLPAGATHNITARATDAAGMSVRRPRRWRSRSTPPRRTRRRCRPFPAVRSPLRRRLPVWP
jgi:hypothetical protein